MDLTLRQREIVRILKKRSPLTGERIAEDLKLSLPTIRPDLRFLTGISLLKARPKVGYEYQGGQLINLDYEHLYHQTIAAILLPTTEIKANDTLQDAVGQLFLNDVGSLYVLDDQENLVGLISRKDLLRASLDNSRVQSMTASMVMTRMPNLITATADMPILEAGRLLLLHQVDSLPVVDKQAPRHVIGKITKNRIFQHFIESALQNS
ncbi:helix-turn-helix transcriptional regulator [Oenococcus kitaharae]|uniref:helix-turn-helix transcriptional regulator n=1 Tax=Oenococcus TaxID=46254 RepID=UPI0021E72DBB|nr:helix-turn-helix transcriptional regulator [Oenococcus kitaharae]MCV3296157.1 helix-turn-helix transcriptional regulator [Oenococcus kitaharae]